MQIFNQFFEKENLIYRPCFTGSIPEAFFKNSELTTFYPFAQVSLPGPLQTSQREREVCKIVMRCAIW